MKGTFCPKRESPRQGVKPYLFLYIQYIYFLNKKMNYKYIVNYYSSYNYNIKAHNLRNKGRKINLFI